VLILLDAAVRFAVVVLTRIRVYVDL